MNDIGGMNVLETAEHLIDKVLDVINRQRLFGVNDAMQIGFHQIGNNVNIIEIVQILVLGRHHIENTDNVLVMEMFHQFDLTENPLGIDFVIEGTRDHLDGHITVFLLIVSRNDNPVGTRADRSKERITIGDGKGFFASLEGMCE